MRGSDTGSNKLKFGQAGIRFLRSIKGCTKVYRIGHDLVWHILYKKPQEELMEVKWKRPEQRNRESKLGETHWR